MKLIYKQFIGVGVLFLAFLAKVVFAQSPSTDIIWGGVQNDIQARSALYGGNSGMDIARGLFYPIFYFFVLPIFLIIGSVVGIKYYRKKRKRHNNLK